MKLTGDNLITGILAAAVVIFLLIIAVVLVIFSARKQRLSQQLKEANYQSKINDISFAALRSQMNPHFIFNCLNSIKYFTEQNNNEAASAYLSKFASLIRSTLDNARCEKITLEEEINSLYLYLDLEAMRFKEKLNYAIIVHDNVDSAFIELPPMIIQPYVENAIWHGLMSKESGGTLTVTISQQDDTAIFIDIKDNGIGRKKAAVLKGREIASHISYGTRIIEERIAILNEKAGNSAAEVSIADLSDANDQPSGTCVTIKLPLR
jgi:LytS/YehU family sensor histidine kinase